MTEGDCEKGLLDVLLERSLLKYDYDDLVYQQVFHARQFDDRLVEMLIQLPADEKVIVIRVGDKLSDALKNRREIQGKISGVWKVCIKPEFEILHLIHEGCFKAFIKEKSKKKASEFYEGVNPDYRKNYYKNLAYFSSLTNSDLVNLLKEYDQKRKGAHGSDELTPLALIREGA